MAAQGGSADAPAVVRACLAAVIVSGLGAGAVQLGRRALSVSKARRVAVGLSLAEWAATLVVLPTAAVAVFAAAGGEPFVLGLGAGALAIAALADAVPEALGTGLGPGVGGSEGFHVAVDWAAANPKPAAAIFQALGWSCVAGGATAVGGLVVFFTPTLSKRADACLLGFAAGVMVVLSLLDIVLPNLDRLGAAAVAANGAAGVAAVQGLRRLLANFHPEVDLEATAIAEGFFHTPRPTKPPAGGGDDSFDPREQGRAAVLVTLALAAHNAPEGLAVGIAAHAHPRRAALMAAAIAMHNVPEGVAVASSVYLATRSRRAAFTIAALTGLVEPISAVLSAALLAPIITEAFVERALCFVAGVMLAVSLQDLAPQAFQAHPGGCTLGAIAGALAMRRGLQVVASLDL